jgi:hypothetical protein
MKGWQAALLSLFTLVLGGVGGFYVGAFGGGLGGTFVGACLTARQAMNSKIITEQQATDLLGSLAEQLGVKLDADRTSPEYSARMKEAIQKCLTEPQVS